MLDTSPLCLLDISLQFEAQSDGSGEEQEFPARVSITFAG
jgi:hypothetical protein